MQYQNFIRNIRTIKRSWLFYFLIFLLLAVPTVLCVWAALIRPADAMTESNGCSYELICDNTSADHLHTASCFGWVCADPSHVHDTSLEYSTAPGSLFGAATHFHIFADQVSIQSHTHGNIAANLLYGKSDTSFNDTINDFGVRSQNLGGKESVNYIRDYAGILNDSTLQTKLVLGNSASFRFNNSDMKYEIRSGCVINNNGPVSSVKTNSFAGNNDNVPIVIEGSTPYIDIDSELDRLSVLSGQIASQKNTDGLEITLNESDMNHQAVVDCTKTSEKYIYGILDMSQDSIYEMFRSKNMEIDGIGSAGQKVLFLNINAGDRTVLDFENHRWAMQGNSDFQELSLDDGGIKIVYNFIRMTDSGPVPYDGIINLKNQIHGTILAPKAEVINNSNINGNIIAGKFMALGGESHRADVQIEGTENENEDWPLLSTDTIDISVIKKWSSNEEHGSVTVALYRSSDPSADISSLGESDRVTEDAQSDPVQPVQILGDENGWSYTWSGLPARDGSDNVIYYYIKEDDVSGYLTEYSDNGASLASKTVTVTNIRLIDISVSKQWYGYDDTGNAAEDTSHGNVDYVEFELYKSQTDSSDIIPPQGAQKVGDTYRLSAPDWTYTVNGLPESENGKPLYYYAKEINVPAGYTPIYTADRSGGQITIKNETDKPEMISVRAVKTWVNAQGITDHPSDVTVQLMRRHGADGEWEKFREPVKFSSEYTFSNLLKQSENINWYYRLDEIDIPAGYTVSYASGNETDAGTVGDGEVYTVNITNTQKTAALEVQKVWRSPADNIDSVSVEIYRSVQQLPMQQTPVSETSAQTSQSQDTEKCISISPVKTGYAYAVSDLIGSAVLDRIEADVECLEGGSGKIEYSDSVSSYNDVSCLESGTVKIQNNTDITSLTLQSYYNLTFTDVRIYYKNGQSGTQQPSDVPGGSYYPVQPAQMPDFSQAELVNTVILDSSTGWGKVLDKLPVCDSEGREFIYYIKEKYITGTGAQNYNILSYSNISGIKLDSDNQSTVSVSNISKDSVIMPSTGGRGPGIYYAAGISIMALAAGLYIGLKKKYQLTFKNNQ